MKTRIAHFLLVAALVGYVIFWVLPATLASVGHDTKVLIQFILTMWLVQEAINTLPSIK